MRIRNNTVSGNRLEDSFVNRNRNESGSGGRTGLFFREKESQNGNWSLDGDVAGSGLIQELSEEYVLSEDDRVFRTEKSGRKKSVRKQSIKNKSGKMDLNVGMPRKGVLSKNGKRGFSFGNRRSGSNGIY